MSSYDPNRITFFAETDARGKRARFGIKAKDRTRHVYVIGKTGMGKSTLLENMAVQDIQNGEGLAFMDPHGSTAEKLLEYIPEHRIKDVLYFAPFDMENPISFNVMEDVGPDKRHLVVSGLMSTFKKIWVDAWSARMEYILSNTLLALLEYPGSTLLGVNRMLSDKDYRNAVVANIKDPSVKSFWVDEFAKYNERYMQEAGDSIKNKVGQFTANPLVRNIIGQPTSSFDVRKMMDEKKILIVNLSKGLIGETNANLLGSMLITKIYLSAMSRADMSASQLDQMPNFYFYVDEFQSFANEAFANILSEARKYKLNLTIAHQYIEQMEEEVRNAVFGNVGTTIAFRVGPFDAEVLETVFSPEFMATDIVNLGFAQIYLTLMIDGIGSRPFSAVTLGPIPQAKVSYKDMAIAESRKQYARPRAEIEASIAKWHEPMPKPEKPPRESPRPELAAVLAPHTKPVSPASHSTSHQSEKVTPVRTERPPLARPEPVQRFEERRAPREERKEERREERKGERREERKEERAPRGQTHLTHAAPARNGNERTPHARSTNGAPHHSTSNGSDRPTVRQPYQQQRPPNKPVVDKEKSLADLKAILSTMVNTSPKEEARTTVTPDTTTHSDLRTALKAVLKDPAHNGTSAEVTQAPSPKPGPSTEVPPPPAVTSAPISAPEPVPESTPEPRPKHTDHAESRMGSHDHSRAYYAEKESLEKLERILKGKR
jgi:hypothetical protein